MRYRARKNVRTVVLVAFVVVLGACGTSGETPLTTTTAVSTTVATTPSTTTTTTPTTSSTTYPPSTRAPSTTSPTRGSDEQGFLANVRRGVPVTGVTDSTLIALGRAVCSAFDRGQTFNAAVQVMVTAGISAYNAGYIIGASMAAFCPEYKRLIPGSDV